MEKSAKKYIIAAVSAIIMIIFLRILYVNNFLPHKKYSGEYFSIPQYHSAVDKDGDGIDDQTDILMGVKSYIATRPVYKSRYYATGYPDDKYGVCTDVSAAGLTAAGYDIMELLNAHVKQHKNLYDIDVIDKNIDFRRVRNLLVYFNETAIPLTTDVHKIEEWQGGDIVIFKGHIGVVSDSRNKNGVPFVFHHNSPFQLIYEQDILESRDDLIAHFRIS